ncbi:hypothetical protein DFQ27_008037 [Actinomortierella ambigua]|uniref:Uncharacterized protein n=1 Tax=Actinomortierella ambigua TaxID=1343610 RepID=A0A9P6PTM1_9FUNG|nr:hypothetical protein DFQ27_008037 [Actinomortierella ambigua]
MDIGSDACFELEMRITDMTTCSGRPISCTEGITNYIMLRDDNPNWTTCSSKFMDMARECYQGNIGVRLINWDQQSFYFSVIKDGKHWFDWTMPVKYSIWRNGKNIHETYFGTWRQWC